MHDTFPLDDFPGRHQYDFTIQPQRTMIDIPQIEKKSLLPVGGISPIHLRPACQTGRNEMATVLFRGILFEIFRQERPWPDKTHLTFQHVEKSRKFIETRAAHQFPESRESIRIGQELSIGPAGIGHRAKFIQAKGLAVKPRAFLHE